MTKDEAIKIIEDACWWYHKKGCTGMTQAEIFEARDMAIKALSQEPTKREIEREYLFQSLCEDFKKLQAENDDLRKRLEQEPCDDAISRDFLFRVLDNFCGHDRTATITLDTLADIVYELPSVTQKSGKWIAQDIHNCHTDFRCSECGYIHSFMHLYGEPTADYTYCPNCGARMVEPQESEDKE